MTDERLVIVPMNRDEANEFLRKHHRHNGPVAGGKFFAGVALGERVVGVAVIGRPVARELDDGWTLEVTRCCTDGTKNAASALYGAAWRAARALGYRRLVTYTRRDEAGTSLRAAGWAIVGEVIGRRWHCVSRPRVENEKQDKFRWERSDTPNSVDASEPRAVGYEP